MIGIGQHLCPGAPSMCPSTQARSAEAGNVRMRLEKAERAIEAERANVRELQRQLAAASQVPPAHPLALSRPGYLFTILALLRSSAVAVRASRGGCFSPSRPAKPSSSLDRCRGKLL